MFTATETRTAGERCRWPSMESIEENVRQARQVIENARRTAASAMAEAELEVRREPLRAFGAAMMAGVMCGAVCGFGAGWFARGGR